MASISNTEHDMETIAFHLQQLLTDHSGKLNAEGLERDVRVILDYIEKYNEGDQNYALLIESLGIDVLRDAHKKLSDTAFRNAQTEKSCSRLVPEQHNASGNYVLARNQVAQIIETISLLLEKGTTARTTSQTQFSY